MHDIVDLEGRGVPAVFVASAQFVDAADAQSQSLGFPTVARVFTPHPIQDRTDEEIGRYADAAFDEIIAAITSRLISRIWFSGAAASVTASHDKLLALEIVDQSRRSLSRRDLITAAHPVAPTPGHPPVLSSAAAGLPVTAVEPGLTSC